MPLLRMEGKTLSLIKPINFKDEPELRDLIGNNLQTVFNCRFIASEFSTGAEHGGRIDTLALSEENNPVIIEYKKVESSVLISQSLYYLHWIKDHRGDFEIAVRKTLGPSVEVDWSDIRVICMAPGFKKYDLHAVKVMGTNIELWEYRLFENGILHLEEVFQRSAAFMNDSPLEVEGKSLASAQGPKDVPYTFEQHVEGVEDGTRELAFGLRDFIMALDTSIEETPRKFYIAYRVAQNFVCMEIKKQKVILFLKLNPSEVSDPPSNARDVTKVGHYGTGDFELTIKTQAEANAAHRFIQMALAVVGG